MTVLPVLQGYVDGEVDESMARHVSGHLERCRRCGMEAETYRSIKAAIGRTGPDRDGLTRRRLEE